MRASRLARVARGLTLAALGATPLACASEPPAPPPPAPAPVLDIASACTEYVAAYETAALCGNPDLVPPGHEPVPPEQLRARKLFEERCRTWLGAPGTSVTPARLHACSARVRAQCVTVYPRAARFYWRVENSTYCDFDVPGTLPDGAPCGDSTQCAGGLCYRPSGGCGACVSRAPVGELCLPYGCAKGGTCEYCKFNPIPPPPAPPAPSCPGKRCLADVTRGIEGYPCRVFEVAAPRTLPYFECATGLVCDEGGTGRCTPPRPPGAPCTRDEACTYYRCDQGACADQSAEGGACNSHRSCRPPLYCDLDRRSCVTRMTAPSAPKLPLGGDCAYDDECAPANPRCVNRTCVPLARLGEACRGSSDDCEDNPFVECIEGKCQLFDPGACR
jgi:hypothetical protein